MRVLDTHTGQFVDIDPRTPGIKYAILSHTWDRTGEQPYGEVMRIQQRYDAEHQVLPSFPPNSQIVHPSISESNHLGASLPKHSQSGTDPSHIYATWWTWPEIVQEIARTETFHGAPSPGHRSLGPYPIWGHPELSPKIREACRVAREQGYDYLWVDSCCIDKTSSSELSESINSMYQWYSRADVCYAFLPDVPANEDHKAKDSRFRRSRWFTRGWTLQELIAPVDVVFLAEDWTAIGSKESLAEPITEITNIDYNALLHIEPLDQFSVAQRLSWAARRETTRVEDQAYSLLGIFDINMPTLYGEGEGAFRRLQEEIMRRTPDQSLFAWTPFGLPDPSSQLHHPEYAHSQKDQRRFAFSGSRTTSVSLLASSIKDFSNCAGIESLSHDEVLRRLRLPAHLSLPATDYDFTPYGIRVQLPVIHFSSSEYFPLECVKQRFDDIPLSQWYLVILGCGHRDFPEHLLGRVCYTQSSGSAIELLYWGFMWVNWIPSTFDLLPIPPATILRLDPSHISSKTLYIPQPQRNGRPSDPHLGTPHEIIKLVWPKKNQDALSARGYAVALRGPDDVRPTTYSVTLTHDTHTIAIEYRHTLQEHPKGQMLNIKAHAEMLGAGLPVPPQGDLGAGAHQGDDRGTTVSWTDGMPWRNDARVRNIELNTPGIAPLTLRLGLKFATRNHYLLHIELQTANIPPLSDPDIAPVEHDRESDGQSAEHIHPASSS
ncbi:hypothetical protein GSI_08732 [Ganoderma sinense ZZ0214-1]|uniref:Uncharacterized protein n=1 Tax=Ganoderma sinense ZZ0214-1 TaxID=1077348 RepID=A0A2G8S551_9APHY|nr:hypothetical protein GSI_08732 [Ganoderma sinense ZZ0214-1]